MCRVDCNALTFKNSTSQNSPGIIDSIAVKGMSNADLSSIKSFRDTVNCICDGDGEHSVGLQEVYPPPGIDCSFSVSARPVFVHTIPVAINGVVGKPTAMHRGLCSFSCYGYIFFRVEKSIYFESLSIYLLRPYYIQ